MFDLLFTSLVYGYLNTADSRTAGIPAASVCALLQMDSDADDIDPRIAITAVEAGDTRSRQISVIAVCRGTSPRSITDPWMNAVSARLADQVALFAYIATLPLAQRIGYQIEKISPPHSGKLQRDVHGPIEVGIGVIFYLTVAPI